MRASESTEQQDDYNLDISAAISGLVIRQGGIGPAMTPQESLSAPQTTRQPRA